jgi:hypothetical protein
VSPGYVDQIRAFQYKGHTVEAHVTRPAFQPRAKGLERRAPPLWIVIVDGDRFGAFPTALDDTEEEVRERIKRWIDEHLPPALQ